MHEWYLESSIRKWLACWRFKSKALRLSSHGTLFLPDLTQLQKVSNFSGAGPEVALSQQGQQLGRKDGCEVENSSDSLEPTKTRETPWGHIGTHEDKLELASFSCCLSWWWCGWAPGEAGALCHRAGHAPIPGLRGARGGDVAGPWGATGQLLPSPTNKESQQISNNTRSTSMSCQHWPSEHNGCFQILQISLWPMLTWNHSGKGILGNSFRLDELAQNLHTSWSLRKFIVYPHNLALIESWFYEIITSDSTVAPLCRTLRCSFCFQ